MSNRDAGDVRKGKCDEQSAASRVKGVGGETFADADSIDPENDLEELKRQHDLWKMEDSAQNGRMLSYLSKAGLGIFDCGINTPQSAITGTPQSVIPGSSG